jgi:group I intron endonuclease
MNNFKIYALKEKNSDEIKYIGLTTKSIKERLSRHLRDKKVDHKTNWIKKVGVENIEIIILEQNIFEHKELCQKEIFYIDKYRKSGHQLTNKTNGGEGLYGVKLTEEHKLKISENHADVSGENNPMFGKKHSEDTMNLIKSKIKEWNNNGGLSNEQRNKISKRVSGETNPNAKLSLQDVLKIRELFDTGEFSKKDLSDMFNVDPPAIYKIINRLTWKNI